MGISCTLKIFRVEGVVKMVTHFCILMYMLCTVRKCMNDLKQRVLESGTHYELDAVPSGLEINE